MRPLIATWILALLAPPLAHAQDAERPDAQPPKQHAPGHLYARGLLLESGEGELEQAIGVYETLLERHRQSRIFAARGLYRMGVCYRRLGRAEDAARAFSRVVREYADQREVSWMARRALDGLRQRDRRPERRGPDDARRRRITDAEELAGQAVRLEREIHGLLRRLEAAPAEKDTLVPRIEELRNELKRVENRREKLAGLERELEQYQRRLQEIGVGAELRALIVRVTRMAAGVESQIERQLARSKHLEGEGLAEEKDKARAMGARIVEVASKRRHLVAQLAELYAALAELRRQGVSGDALHAAEKRLEDSQSKLLTEQRTLQKLQDDLAAELGAWTERLAGRHGDQREPRRGRRDWDRRGGDDRRPRDWDRRGEPHGDDRRPRGWDRPGGDRGPRGGDRRWDRRGGEDHPPRRADDREARWRAEIDAMAAQLAEEGLPKSLIRARVQLELDKMALRRIARELERRLDGPRSDQEAEQLDRARNTYRSVAERIKEGLEHARKAIDALGALEGDEREKALEASLKQLQDLQDSRKRTFEQLRRLLPPPPHRDGPRHDGPPRRGGDREGPRHEGPRHEGPRHEGPRHEGPRRDGDREPASDELRRELDARNARIRELERALDEVRRKLKELEQRK